MLGHHRPQPEHRGDHLRRLQTVFGGEITMFTELAMSTRNEAMNRLEITARQMGGNCIVGMRFDSSELMQNTNEIVAYGTAGVIRQMHGAA